MPVSSTAGMAVLRFPVARLGKMLAIALGALLPVLSLWGPAEYLCKYSMVRMVLLNRD